MQQCSHHRGPHTNYLINAWLLSSTTTPHEQRLLHQAAIYAPMHQRDAIVMHNHTHTRYVLHHIMLAGNPRRMQTGLVLTDQQWTMIYE
jgi:hypothetical protein